MKKIIAILLALAVVSMAFAQTVSISNTLKSEPTITIDGGAHYWGFANDFMLRDEVNADASTADGRARVKARVRFDLQPLTPTEKTILNVKPRWSWNSQCGAPDGRRTSVAAWLKPFDFLEVGIGNFDGVDSGWGIVPNLSWYMGPEYFKWGFNETVGLAGKYQNIHQLINDGIQVKYIGVPNLEIGFGLRSAGDLDKETMIKKGMFNGAALGATYNTDLFGLGIKWAGNFGAENGVEANNSDKAYQDHLILAGITFRGLQEAKIGTTLEATVGFYTEKASAIKNANTATTAFIIGVASSFNFRNGITDRLSVEVGYNKVGSKTSKVLPFTVRNKLGYSVSSDANFSFDLMYSQVGLLEKTKATAAGNNGTNFGGNVAKGLNGATETEKVWLIGVKPTFSWNMGAHSFEIGVATKVIGNIEPHPKSGWEWGWTGLKGIEAEVGIPVSWKYTF
ncbi:MAG: hypothetical protein IKK38_09160 [Spirochaetaceae bacterium]|nr:hypothetical protein [Spirochaetaceae bacterium]